MTTIAIPPKASQFPSHNLGKPSAPSYLFDHLLGRGPAEFSDTRLPQNLIKKSSYSYLDMVVGIITAAHLEKNSCSETISPQTNFVLSMIRLSGANGPKRGYTTLADSNLNLFIKPRLTTQDVHYSTDSSRTRHHKLIYGAVPNSTNGLEDGRGSRLSAATLALRAARIPTKQFKTILGAKKPLAKNKQSIRLNRKFLERNGLAVVRNWGGWKWEDKKLSRWSNTVDFTSYKTDTTVINNTPGLKKWASRCIEFIESPAGTPLFAHNTSRSQRYSVWGIQVKLARDLRMIFGLEQPTPASPRKRKDQPAPMTDEQYRLRRTIKMLSYTVPGLEGLPAGVAAKIIETNYPTITPEDLKPTTFLPKIIGILENREELWRLRWASGSDPLISFLYYLKLLVKK